MLGSEAKMQIQEILDLISLGEDVRVAVKKAAKSIKVECDEVGKRVNRLVQMLKTLYCFITSAPTDLYLRPINCIVAEVEDNFNLVMEIVRKCKHQNLLSRVLFNSRNVTKFKKLLNLLDGSISDMQWLVTAYGLQSEAIDPTMYKRSTKFLIWACIATVQMGRQLEERVMAAECLELLAREKDEYKNMIFEEGGVPPLQNLLKEKYSPLDAQVTAAMALCRLADEKEREKIIMKEMISTIVNRLSRTSPIWDQIQAANLVASIAMHIPEVKEYNLISENVIWRLVTLLSSEPCADDPRTNKLKLNLKISCSKALWMLARGSVSNCRTLTDTRGMLCIAKLMETEQGELHFNCLMILREITAIAESSDDFRRSAFKRTSTAANAVVDELLKIIKEHDKAKMRIPAIKSIGSLARSFAAKESRVISPLVAQLDNTDQEIAVEAAIALQKFVSPDNYICFEHSKSIIEFNGVPLVMKLLKTGDKMLQRHGLALICRLAEHDSNSNVLIKAGALTALETTGRLVAAGDPKLEELVCDAIAKLEANQTGKYEELDSSSKGSIKDISTEPDKVVSDSSRLLFKLPTKGLTLSLTNLENLQVDRKTSEIVMISKKRFLPALRSFTTRRAQPFPKSDSLELALRLMMEIPRKLKLVKKFVKPFKKKEIRKMKFLQALRSVATRRSHPSLKSESLELALISMMEYTRTGARLINEAVDGNDDVVAEWKAIWKSSNSWPHKLSQMV
ncbi:hypothetical protein DITRI_Ditri08aG0161700 [Diplodiscus trichospermus]